MSVPVSPGATAIRFDEALAGAVAAGDVAGLAASVQTRREGLSRLSSLPANPLVTFQPGVRTTEGVSTGPEGQLTLSQNFNLGGLGSARKAVAGDEAETAGLQLRALLHARRMSAAAAWLDAWAAQEAAQAAHEEEDQANELRVRLERAVTTGGVTRVELAVARAFAAEAAALHLEWEGRRVEAGAALSNLLGLDAIAVASGPLPTYPTLDAAALAGVGSLATLMLERELHAEDSRAVEAKALWATSLQLSLQGGRDAPNQWFGNVGIGLTLPLFEHGHRERSVHQANALRLSGEASLSQKRARITRDVAIHELEHSAETLEVVKMQQLPAAREAAELEAKRYALGEATLFELTLLRRQALSARIATALAEARFAGARATAHELLETR